MIAFDMHAFYLTLLVCTSLERAYAVCDYITISPEHEYEVIGVDSQTEDKNVQPSSLLCWRIQDLDTNGKLALTFKDAEKCQGEIRVYDGMTPDAALLERFLVGTRYDHTIFSTGPILLITYVADAMPCTSDWKACVAGHTSSSCSDFGSKGRVKMIHILTWSTLGTCSWLIVGVGLIYRRFCRSKSKKIDGENSEPEIEETHIGTESSHPRIYEVDSNSSLLSAILEEPEIISDSDAKLICAGSTPAMECLMNSPPSYEDILTAKDVVKQYTGAFQPRLHKHLTCNFDEIPPSYDELNKRECRISDKGVLMCDTSTQYDCFDNDSSAV